MATGMKSYKCTGCRKSFKVKTALVKHLKTHKQERTYECLTCGKDFSKKSSLVIHQQSHAEAKPSTCNECGETFGQRSTLRAHTPKKASKDIACASKQPKHDNCRDKKPYSCMDCKKTFILHKNFIKHQAIHARHLSPGPARASPQAEQASSAEEKTVDLSGLMLQELSKMRENVDMLLLNQHSQLQVLQEIQKQLGVLLPGVYSNVHSLGLLLGRQAASRGSPFASPLLSPSNILPESANPSSSQMSS